jgi:hypothetical protein
MKKIAHFRFHKTEDEKKERKELYKSIRAKGFSASEARIARDYRNTVIKEILEGKRALNGRIAHE